MTTSGLHLDITRVSQEFLDVLDGEHRSAASALLSEIRDTDAPATRGFDNVHGGLSPLTTRSDRSVG